MSRCAASSSRLFLTVALVVTSASIGSLACAGGTNSGEASDASVEERDAGVALIDAAGGCDPSVALPLQWRSIDAVDASELTIASGAGVTSAIIDATAGGADVAADNPHLYLDLLGAAKVAITDVDARADSSWHLALKRSSIRINGGDSGPGGMTVAVVDAESLAAVTEAPAASSFRTDDWATEDCEFVPTASGEPATAMSDWYDYDDEAHRLTPWPQVWILGLGDDSYIKLRIESYYADLEQPMRGGVYQIEWAPL